MTGTLCIGLAKDRINKRKTNQSLNVYGAYTWEHPVMSNSKRWMELRLVNYFTLNKGKGALGFWVGGGKL